MVTVQVAGGRVRAIVDTQCAQTLIWADLAPWGQAPNSTSVRIIYMYQCVPRKGSG